MLVCVTKNEEWNIPKIDIDSRFNYKIGVRRINFKIHRTNMEHNHLICLRSSAVDLTNRNPLQALEFFTYDSGSEIQSFCSSIVNFHSLTLRDLEDASFDLIDPWSEHEILFSNFFVQLEILRQDSYGRVF